MDATRAMSLVGTNVAVVAVDNAFGAERVRGKVIGYTDRPMVLIEDEAGRQIWWATELTHTVNGSEL